MLRLPPHGFHTVATPLVLGLLLAVPLAVAPWMAGDGAEEEGAAMPPRAWAAQETAAADAGMPVFAAPLELPDSNGHAEPSIAVAPDGTLYIAAPGGGGTGVWRSDDLGASWARVADTLGNGGDSDVAVDADGVVYASDLSGNAPVSVSFDRGATFEFITDTNTGNSLDRQWLQAVGSGLVFATVRDGNNEELSISTDQGRTYGDPITVATGTAHRGNILAVGAQDLYVPFTTNEADAGLHLAVSHDGGQNWAIRDVGPVLGSDCIFPAVARDAAGTLYMTWCEYKNAAAYPPTVGRGILLSVSHDDGLTWDAPVVLSDDANYNVFPWIAAGAAGRVFVAWFEGVPSYDDSLLGMRDPNVAPLVDWHVTVAFSDAADSAAPAFATQAVTGIIHTGPICTGGSGCLLPNPVVGNRALLDFFEIAEMQDGNLAITFAGSDSMSIPPQPGQQLGLVAKLYAVVQTGGANLRTG